jgi:hypothetical protein
VYNHFVRKRIDSYNKAEEPLDEYHMSACLTGLKYREGYEFLREVNQEALLNALKMANKEYRRVITSGGTARILNYNVEHPQVGVTLLGLMAFQNIAPQEFASAIKELIQVYPYLKDIFITTISDNAWLLKSLKIFRKELSKQKDLLTESGSGYVGKWYGDDDMGRKLASQGERGVELLLNFGVGTDKAPAFIVFDRSMLAVEESTKTK